MNVEDVAWKSFTSRRTAQQKRQFSISLGVLGEVVVHDQYIPPLPHKELGDASRGVRSYVAQPWRIVSFGNDHDGIFHRAMSL